MSCRNAEAGSRFDEGRRWEANNDDGKTPGKTFARKCGDFGRVVEQDGDNRGVVIAVYLRRKEPIIDEARRADIREGRRELRQNESSLNFL